MAEGIIFNIQRFSLHDGPGVRTTVFLKGCPLDCLWCHNPESKSPRLQLAFSEKLCVGCGKCEQVCEHHVHSHDEKGKKIDFDACIACEKCVQACPTAALEIMGKRISVEEVVEEVVRDIPFYGTSGGGVTISGGDPAMQPEFAVAILKGAKEHQIHTALETAGHASWSVYEKMLPFLDMVLFDSKQMDDEKHRAYVGQSNGRIHENLRRFCEADKKVEVVVRTPVIPGYNDQPENFRALAAFLHTMERVPRVEVLPYNPLAGSKHPRLGMTYLLDIEEGDGTAPEALCRILTEQGITAKVVR